MVSRLMIATVTALVLPPVSAIAQQAERTVETTSTTVPAEHHDFPWGLLGLIGLAGLIPRKQTVVPVNRTTVKP